LRQFEYDALYRLLSATGRECDTPPEPPPWDDRPRCTDLTRTRTYTETYQYDKVGNILQLQHDTNRDFALVPGSNRLATVTIGQQNTFNYTYDSDGNLVQETTSRHFEWDHSDRMRVYRTQAGTAEPSVHAHYLYDSAGQRVKKLVRKQGGQIEVTTYIDELFEDQSVVQGGSSQENNSLHIMDNQNRIALLRVGKAFSDDSRPQVKYHLGDHLSSSNVVVGGASASNNNLINREEYTPYGETSFGSFGRKRYRFTEKERDEESGLYYFGARLYTPWLGRWVSCDPAGTVDGLNLYSYTRNNPIVLSDLQGTDSEVQGTWTSQGTSTSTQDPLNPEGNRITTVRTQIFQVTPPSTQSANSSAQASDEPDTLSQMPHPPAASHPGDDTRANAPQNSSAKSTLRESARQYLEVDRAVHDEIISLMLDFLRNPTPPGVPNPIKPLTDPLYDRAEQALTTPESQQSGLYKTARAAVMVGSFFIPGAGEEAAAIKLESAVIKTQRASRWTKRAYSVITEVTLTKPERVRYMPEAERYAAHFNEASEKLLKKMETNEPLREAVTKRGFKAIEQLMGGKAPKGLTWHHHPGRVGVMQLVRSRQHWAKGAFTKLFHPLQGGIGNMRARGGMWKWGHLF
jgi:RHS repeat-associated protein